MAMIAEILTQSFSKTKSQGYMLIAITDGCDYAYNSTFGFFLTIERSFKLAPLGRPWPYSHDWTVLVEMSR
jgi:hypothetical protein